MEAYCVKCRAKREMKDARSITMKNGKLGDPGCLPRLCHHDVSHWQELIRSL